MNFSLTSKFPFFVKADQTLPVTMPKRKSDTEGLSDRNIQSDMLQDWFLQLPSKIPPKRIDAILRMANAGNIWEQQQLTNLMQTTWPMFRKVCFELRAAISSAKFIVHPYCVPGEKPTDSSEEKADLVRRALDAFKPSRFADEDGLGGMVFDLTDAIINGISIVELLWNENATDPEGRPEKNIRASGWVHPRNYAFTSDGRVGVAYAAESGNMSFSNVVRHEMMDNPSKFLVAKFKSKSGSCLGAGFMRPLTWYWVMIVYGRDWSLAYSQKYGNPFLDIAYQASLSSNPSEVDKFEKLALQAANQGYFVHPDSAKLVIGAEHKMGGDNAQLALMRLADEQCQLLMLGQTLTTSAPVNGGTRAQGEVHENVRQERLEEHTKWIARILTEQFAESLLIENFGESSERPTVEADMTRPLSAVEQADYLSKIGQTRVPLLLDPVYKRAGMEQPSPGDKVLIQGQPAILEEAMTPTEKQEKDFETQFEQQVATAQFQGQQGNENEPKEKSVTAHRIQAALVDSPEDAAELENLVLAAERSPNNNGEVKAVEAKVLELVNKGRF
jgi:phage gp29-like protein